MRSFARAAESYGAVQVMSGVASADNVQLIQMLFDGFLESLCVAKGHILNNAIEEKSKSISRASRIVVGLQGALDFQRGGELAQNLNDLYNYVLRRLIHVNVRNDLQALEEIHGLMQDVAEAWQNLPALLGTAGRQTQFAS
ncbi:MAG: flagellar export chaperone FliS [Betaproteobacteria bacterium]|nr:flagellar export chaperone FliS [Betaproteobacteria bacterium]